MATVDIKTNYEVERGKPMPSKNHSLIQSNLIFQLRLQCDERYSIPSEITIELPSGKRGTPDLAIFPKLEMNVLHDEIAVKEAPLTVIEILSPTQSLQEILDRKAQYFQLGVQSVWVVIPAYKTIYIHTSDEDYTTFSDDVVLKDESLEIELDLKKIFE